jgi:very-short-patch-repair endonuclease
MSDAMKHRIDEVRSSVLDVLTNRLDVESSALDSPIEEAMFWGLLAQLETIGSAWAVTSLQAFVPVIRQGKQDAQTTIPRAAGVDGFAAGVTSDGYVIRLFTQYPVEIRKRTYRLDFALMVDSHALGARTVPVKVAIECDGHDFHEKTKVQAQHDKVRDRDLQSSGWHVARFTGAEIFASPREAGAKAIQFLHDVLEQREKETK